MHGVLRLETAVLPGHRLELSDPQLPEGASVQVLIMMPSCTEIDRPAMLDLLKSLPGGPRLFDSPEAADRYLQEERDSWDR
jgi:hypothetical protein